MGDRTRGVQLTADEQQLLRLLRQGSHEVADLAQALCTSPERIERVLGSLGRKVGLVRCVRSGTLRYGLAE